MRDIFIEHWNCDESHGVCGYKASAPLIPGCVVRHRDPAFAVMLVREAVIAMNEEDRTAAPTDTSDEIHQLSHRSA